MVEVWECVDKRYADRSSAELIDASPEVLRGVSGRGAEHLREILGVRTVRDLAENRFVNRAYELCELARTKPGTRVDPKYHSWLDRAYEDVDVAELLNAPVDTLQGISGRDAEVLRRSLRVRTLQDLAYDSQFIACAYEIWDLETPQQGVAGERRARRRPPADSGA